MTVRNFVQTITCSHVVCHISAGRGGGENNKNQNKLTFRMGDRKQLQREKPSKKSSHAGKLRLFSPEKVLVSLQILQRGKV